LSDTSYTIYEGIITQATISYNYYLMVSVIKYMKALLFNNSNINIPNNISSNIKITYIKLYNNNYNIIKINKNIFIINIKN